MRLSFNVMVKSGFGPEDSNKQWQESTKMQKTRLNRWVFNQMERDDSFL